MQFQQVAYDIPLNTGLLQASPSWKGLYLISGGFQHFTPLPSEDVNMFSNKTRKRKKRFGSIAASGQVEFLAHYNDVARLAAVFHGGYDSKSADGTAVTYIFKDGNAAWPIAWRDRRKSGNNLTHFLKARLNELALFGKAMDDVHCRVGFQCSLLDYGKTSATDTYEDTDDVFYAGNDRSDITATVLTWTPDGGSAKDLTPKTTDFDIPLTVPLSTPNTTLTSKGGIPIDGTREFGGSITYDFGYEDADNYEDTMLAYFIGKSNGSVSGDQDAPLKGTLSFKVYGPEIETGKPSFIEYSIKSYVNIPDFKVLSGESIDRTAKIEFPYIESYEMKVCCDLTDITQPSS